MAPPPAPTTGPCSAACIAELRGSKLMMNRNIGRSPRQYETILSQPAVARKYTSSTARMPLTTLARLDTTRLDIIEFRLPRLARASSRRKDIVARIRRALSVQYESWRKRSSRDPFRKGSSQPALLAPASGCRYTGAFERRYDAALVVTLVWLAAVNSSAIAWSSDACGAVRPAEVPRPLALQPRVPVIMVAMCATVGALRLARSSSHAAWKSSDCFSSSPPRPNPLTALILPRPPACPPASSALNNSAQYRSNICIIVNSTVKSCKAFVSSACRARKKPGTSKDPRTSPALNWSRTGDAWPEDLNPLVLETAADAPRTRKSGNLPNR